MKSNNTHTFFFKVVSTCIFLLLLLQNVALSYPKKQSFFGRFVRAMYSLFLDAPSTSYPRLTDMGTSTYSGVTKTKTYTTLADSCRDPVCLPPKP